MDFESVLESIHFKKINGNKILQHIPFLKKKWNETARNKSQENETSWIMGQLREEALGNIALAELKKHIEKG
jgi:hypothetical protein